MKHNTKINTPTLNWEKSVRDDETVWTADACVVNEVGVPYRFEITEVMNNYLETSDYELVPVWRRWFQSLEAAQNAMQDTNTTLYNK